MEFVTYHGVKMLLHQLRSEETPDSCSERTFPRLVVLTRIVPQFTFLVDLLAIDGAMGSFKLATKGAQGKGIIHNVRRMA